MVMAS